MRAAHLGYQQTRPIPVHMNR